MRVVCEEVHGLALEIAGLGDLLSEKPDASAALQSFDALSQRALAQARLLAGLQRAFQGEDAQWRSRIDALIAAVPFHADRMRLSSALQPAQGGDMPAADGGGIEWF